VLARTAEHVGVEAVRHAEASLLKAAETRDPGQLVGVAKDFEHRVDAQAALREANRAYERRYLHVSEPMDGFVRLDGLLDTEGGAIVRRAIDAGLLPEKHDDRTAGQRRADRLVDLCRAGSSPKVSGGSPSGWHLIVKASVETLTGTAGAPAGELEGGGTLPAETVRRIACDSAISRMIGQGELAGEITHASRTTPPATKRAVAVRDRHCVFPGCDRPKIWCDTHHLQFWSEGGPTTVENLALLCRPHHRKVHEGGWRLECKDGRFIARRPEERCRSG
jgi:hypothetical protein